MRRFVRLTKLIIYWAFLIPLVKGPFVIPFLILTTGFLRVTRFLRLSSSSGSYLPRTK